MDKVQASVAWALWSSAKYCGVSNIYMHEDGMDDRQRKHATIWPFFIIFCDCAMHTRDSHDGNANRWSKNLRRFESLHVDNTLPGTVP